MKHFKGIIALLMTGVMALSFASCASSGIEPLDFADQFNKNCESYQIDPSYFTENTLESGNKTRSYSFRSDNQDVGTFIMTAYIPGDSDAIDRITLFLPVDAFNLGALFGQDTEIAAISADRKAAFKDLFTAIAQSYADVSKSTATNYFAEMGLDDDATYTNKTTTTQTYGDYTFTFTVTSLATSLQITNDKLYTPETVTETA